MTEIGRIGRPHGLAGELNVHLTTNLIDERTQSGLVFTCSDTELVVKSVRPKGSGWLFGFEGIDSKEDAQRFAGKDLLAPALEGDRMVHNLVGKSLVDQHGTDHGLITSIQANPASDLLILESSYMVPMAFYCDTVDGVVHVDVPDGLFE